MRLRLRLWLRLLLSPWLLLHDDRLLRLLLLWLSTYVLRLLLHHRLSVLGLHVLLVETLLLQEVKEVVVLLNVRLLLLPWLLAPVCRAARRSGDLHVATWAEQCHLLRVGLSLKGCLYLTRSGCCSKVLCLCCLEDIWYYALRVDEHWLTPCSSSEGLAIHELAKLHVD